MSFTLKLGTAVRNITPPYPVPLAGFGHRQGVSEGVSHPLCVKAMVLQSQPVSGPAPLALIVSADIIWWGPERMERLYEAFQERWGIKRSAVILNATHTHSGPQTSDRFASEIGEADRAYVDGLEAALLDGIEEALRNLEPVAIERGSGECRIGVNRRKLENGHIVMAPNEDGPADSEVSVIRFRTEDGLEKAIIVHLACHPTTTDLNMISSEFPGVAMELLEAKLGSGCTAFFMQGCCGDVRPRLVREGRFYRGDGADVVRFGSELAEAAFRVLERPMRALRPRPVSGRSAALDLPLEAGTESGTEPHTVPFQMNLVRIAEGLSLLAMNGEVVTEYGFYAKRLCTDVLPVAYSNGMIGYVPTAAQIAEGGYEADESHRYFRLPSRFSPSVEETVKNGIRALIQG
ncbi:MULTISPECIES: neutral/alkaline non-lysosomal ceramidase N-terminal domain-containing protein [unclassified Paenibacillus]|uniref:neutral/alkaline non-lysosomal ceramidase N-terminal domain-containing protein n=1 Tax=unclassified Paenibacillus TaxID=185978 RepID=UPI001C111DC9|nr:MULTISPECIES: neutral/alkaline non-lysosomal ceramidase N-terminal domain-containing protein [unclassified Paenibacillus]MBU5444396.1 neutral/alkaline non-lysosomal ceramidase N-terminal domain-containing protein [Paenibacillus sp. MSJ-34]CAH0120177.1 hypothetical protein PAE9249_02690 [Paenibacillus sp. CECT 9249]